MTKQRQDYAVKRHKALVKALLWSLLAHILVLGGMRALPEPVAWATLPATLVAQFVPQAVAVPPGAPVAPNASRPKPTPVAKPPSAVPPAPTFAPTVATESTAMLPIKAEGPTNELTSIAATMPAANVSAPAISAAPSAGVDPDGLRSYRMALAVQARRFKRYPAQAQASGWEGTTEVRLTIALGGRPTGTEVVKSSGREALDRAAQAMIEAAAARAALPNSLQGLTFAVILPVVFNLEDP